MSSSKIMLKAAALLTALSATVMPASAVTVYFDNKDTDWNTPYCYCWDNNKQAYVTWAGEPMTLYHESVWKYEIPDGHGYANVLFNRGSSAQQTADLIVEENRVYNLNGATEYTIDTYPWTNPPVPQEPEPFTVYFDTYEAPWGTAHCLPHANGKLMEVESTAMSLRAGSVWQYTVPAGCESVSFSDGGTVYTASWKAIPNMVYSMSGSTGKTVSQWSTPTPEVFVYLDGNWTNPNIYVYTENPSATNAEWPGKPMTYDAALGLWKYSMPEAFKNNSLVIISAQGGSPRYPGDNERGMDFNGSSMVLVADGCQWMTLEGYLNSDSSNLGEYSGYSDENGTVTIAGTNGKIFITPWTPEIVKVLTLKNNAKVWQERPSIAVVSKEDPLLCYDIPEVNYSIDDSENELLIEIADGVTVVVDKNSMLLTFYENDVELLSESTGLINAATGGNTRAGFATDSKHEAFYGGGYNGNWMNWSGHTMTMNNTQVGGWHQGLNPPFNICVPYFVSTKGYGVFFDSNHRNAKISFSADETSYSCSSLNPVAYYFIGGGSMERAMQNYNHLTGHQNLPPFWALGYITSKFSFETDSEARQTVENTKNVNIPIDGIVFDIHWQSGSGRTTGMGFLDWDPNAFPNKEGLIKDLLKQNVHALAITEPFFNSTGNAAANYNYLRDNNYLADTHVTANSNMTWIGNGASVGLIDASNPDAMAWFANQYITHTRKGMSGWWLDLGEPEAYSPQFEGSTHHLSGTPDQVHNEFGNLWTGAVYTRLATAEELYDDDLYPGVRIKDMRHITLPRAGSAGMQRFGAFPWTGDILRDWSGLQAQVPALVSAAMSGISYLGSDIGGFTATGTIPDLYRRWVQLGVFYPMMRTHSETKPEVWREEYNSVRDDVRNAINLRYAYLPYLYTRSYEYTRFGTPIARPSNFYDENPMANPDCIDSYLWGPDIFVAPVLSYSNQKSITFPDGEWLDMNDFQHYYAGGTTRSENVSPSTLPHYMRRGSLIPRYRQDTFTNTAEIETDKLIVDLFPRYDGEPSTGSIFEDDRTSSNTIADGKYLLTRFDAYASSFNDDNSLAIYVLHEGNGWENMPETRDILFRIHDFRISGTAQGGALNTGDFEISCSGDASDSMRREASENSSAPVQVETPDDVLNAPDTQNSFAQVGNTMYLRIPKLPVSNDMFLSAGTGNIFTGLELPETLFCPRLSFDGTLFTYQAPENSQSLSLRVFSTTGTMVRDFSGLTADGASHQLNAQLPAGIYIASLEARNSAGIPKASTIKLLVRN